MTINFTLRKTTWRDDEARLRLVRERVFIDEQHVPAELEWDGLDGGASHWLAMDDAGNAIGTARLLDDGHVGRMAVLAGYRNMGVGSALLKTIIAAATRAGMSSLFLDAQLAALGFYAKHGFRAEGEVFEDAGIPHRRMTLALPVDY